jgi:hypothetical protein
VDFLRRNLEEIFKVHHDLADGNCRTGATNHRDERRGKLSFRGIDGH